MLKPIYSLSASVGISKTGDVWTYADLAEGIDNLGETLNEVVQQYQFLSGEGFAKNHVTGMAPSWSFSGKRVLGDDAQDYIFGLKYTLGDARESSFKLSYTDASATPATKTITVPCTVCNMQEWSGASTDDSAISFELRFDGKPTVGT